MRKWRLVLGVFLVIFFLLMSVQLFLNRKVPISPYKQEKIDPKKGLLLTENEKVRIQNWLKEQKYYSQ
jgi:hypothetical protein